MKKEDILKIKNPFLGQRKLMTDNARKSNSKLRPDGYIYILKMIGFDIYKIGVSSNPERRIKDIDNLNPFGIEVISINFFKNAYEMEECIHDSFCKNIFRKEWFKIHPEDIVILSKQLNDFSIQGLYLTRR